MCLYFYDQSCVANSIGWWLLTRDWAQHKHKVGRILELPKWNTPPHTHTHTFGDVLMECVIVMHGMNSKHLLINFYKVRMLRFYHQPFVIILEVFSSTRPRSANSVKIMHLKNYRWLKLKRRCRSYECHALGLMT